MRLKPCVVLSLVVAVAGCERVNVALDRVRRVQRPLELPVLLSTELPFSYPQALLGQPMHGDVTLRLFIDSLGKVLPESTTVVEAAEYAAFDTAAIDGAAQLVFRPARRGNRAVGMAVLFPIKFRVPGVPPPPGDSTSHRQPSESR
jgi:TonB family protein